MADLHELMRAAAATGPRPDGLLAEAERSAQRHVRRRRSAAAAGTSALVAAIAVGAAVLPLRDASRTTGSSATSVATPAPATTTATPATAASSTVVAVAATSGVPVTPTAAGLPTLSAPELRRLQTAPFFYDRLIYADGTVQDTRQTWQGHYARGRMLEGTTYGTGVAWSSMGSQFTWEQLSTLTDPTALRKVLMVPVQNGESVPYSVEQAFLSAPLDGPVSPGFVAGVFTVLRDLPGVVETTGVTDAGGRPGVALQQKSLRYIFSPDHGRLLERDDLPQGGCSSHAAWDRLLFLESGPVDSTTETVPAETLPLQPSPSLCPGG
jgi:hypothetical protein